jgi:hypothetical protein
VEADSIHDEHDVHDEPTLGCISSWPSIRRVRRVCFCDVVELARLNYIRSFNGGAARDLAVQRLTSGVPLRGNGLQARSQNHERPDNRAHRVPV